MTARLPHGPIAALALALLSSTAAAQAVDGEAFVARLSAVMEAQGTPFQHGAVATDGDTVTVSEMRFGEGADGLALGTVRFETVAGSDSEGWTAARVPLDPIEGGGPESRTAVEGMVVEGLAIPAADAPEAASAPLTADRIAFDTLSVARGDETAATFNGFALDNAGGDEGGFAADFALEEFVIDTTVAADDAEGGAPAIEELGYSELRGDFSGNALWNTTSGELALRPILVNVEEAGSLSFSYAITGYTPAFVRSLSELQAQMAANPENRSAGIAMLGLVSQLFLNSAEIRFEDASLTNRLLDYYAGENGIERDAQIEQLIGALPVLLGYLNNPEFQAEVTEQVSAFLRDPQSLRIAVEPDAPIPAANIIGAVAGAPATLPALLDLTVTSNE